MHMYILSILSQYCANIMSIFYFCSTRILKKKKPFKLINIQTNNIKDILYPLFFFLKIKKSKIDY